MADGHYNILLADDDPDDCMFFKDALAELDVSATLTTVNDGVELINYLENKTIDQFPDVLFLDLNMPRKSGQECLTELKQNKTYQQIPVIIFSTSSNPDVMDLLYDKGAQYYIRKPADFANLKAVINKALRLSRQNKMVQPPRERFKIHLK